MINFILKLYNFFYSCFIKISFDDLVVGFLIFMYYFITLVIPILVMLYFIPQVEQPPFYLYYLN